jgi:hypothetical protein
MHVFVGVLIGLHTRCVLLAVCGNSRVFTQGAPLPQLHLPTLRPLVGYVGANW